MSKVKFGDVVREVKKKIDRNNNPYEHYVAGHHMDTEDLRIRRRGRFDTDDVGPAFIRVFEKGQILYGSRRTYLKKVAVADFDGITANTTFVLETKNEQVLRHKLIPFIMLSEGFTQWSIMKSKGSTNPYVLFSDLAGYEFELPTIEQQDKLVELLWGFVELQDAYNALLKQTDELVKSQFIELFGDPILNSQNWEVVPLRQCLYNIENGKSFVCENCARKDSWPAVLKLSAATSGYYVPEENKAVIKKSDFVTSAAVRKGDLLFTRKNTPELVGMCAFVYETPEMLMLPDIIFRLNVNESCHKIYLWKLINMDIFREKVRSLASGTAKSMSNISKERLMELLVIRPPYELQDSFARFIEQLDKSKYAGCWIENRAAA